MMPGWNQPLRHRVIVQAHPIKCQSFSISVAGGNKMRLQMPQQRLTNESFVIHLYFIAHIPPNRRGDEHLLNRLNSSSVLHRIALIIRSNRADGQKGRLECVQAMGWYLKEQNIAQVTVNILDHDITSLHHVYEEVVKESIKLKLPVTGSELVGMVPLKAMLDVAEFYIKKESLFVLEEDQKIHLAINRLGLNSISHFDPKKRIIEYMIQEDDPNKLINQTFKGFAKMVADRTSAPGGGSVGAAVGSLGAGLSSMVAKLSFGRKMFEKTDEQMRNLIPPLHNAVDKFLQLVDEDTQSFNKYFEARALPQRTQYEIEKLVI